MEDINYLNEIDILFPQEQKEYEESLKQRLSEKDKRREEYLKNKKPKEEKEYDKD